MQISPYFLVVLALYFTGCVADADVNSKSSQEKERRLAKDVNFRQTDNVIRVGLSNEPASINPVLSSSSIGRYVHELIFQSLNGEHPDDFSPTPLLASLPDIQPEANGRVGYAYVLNPNATWPNGLPVTAADVVFSMKIVLSPLIGNGAYRSYYDAVSNIVTSPNDERRFKVMTDEPYLLSQTAIGSLVIFPEHVYDPNKSLRSVRLRELATDRGAAKLAESNEALITFAEAFNELATSRDPKDLVGTGPYRLESWEAGQQITLLKQPDYWAGDADDSWLVAEPTAIEFKFIPDANTMGTALRDELIDVTTSLPVESFQTLREEAYLKDRFDFAAIDGLKYYGILFNQQLPLFKDAATRKALAKLVDVDVLIEQLFPGGLAARVTSPVMPAKPYFDADLPAVTYNLEEAKQELAEAGWSDSDGNGILDREVDGEFQELSYEFLIFPSPTSESIGALVVEWAAAAGVEIKVVPKDGRSLFGDLNKGDFATAIIGQSFAPTPDDFTQMWASSSVPPNGTNRGGFADRDTDRLLQRIRTTLDEDKRAPLYKEFQRIIADNQPMIFLFSTKDRIVVSRRLRYDLRAKTPNLFFNALRQQPWNEPGE